MFVMMGHDESDLLEEKPLMPLQCCSDLEKTGNACMLTVASTWYFHKVFLPVPVLLLFGRRYMPVPVGLMEGRGRTDGVPVPGTDSRVG